MRGNTATLKPLRRQYRIAGGDARILETAFFFAAGDPFGRTCGGMAARPKPPQGQPPRTSLPPLPRRPSVARHGLRQELHRLQVHQQLRVHQFVRCDPVRRRSDHHAHRPGSRPETALPDTGSVTSQTGPVRSPRCPLCSLCVELLARRSRLPLHSPSSSDPRLYTAKGETTRLRPEKGIKWPHPARGRRLRGETIRGQHNLARIEHPADAGSGEFFYGERGRFIVSQRHIGFDFDEFPGTTSLCPACATGSSR